MAITSNEKSLKRRMRIRKKIIGLAERPRLCLHRSNRHLYAQLIDDKSNLKGSVCIAFVSTYTKETKNTNKNFCNKANAKKIAEKISEIAKAKNITKIVFDRNGQQFHGIVKEFAETARKCGLIF